MCIIILCACQCTNITWSAYVHAHMWMYMQVHACCEWVDQVCDYVYIDLNGTQRPMFILCCTLWTELLHCCIYGFLHYIWGDMYSYEESWFIGFNFISTSRTLEQHLFHWKGIPGNGMAHTKYKGWLCFSTEQVVLWVYSWHNGKPSWAQNAHYMSYTPIAVLYPKPLSIFILASDFTPY